MLANPLNLNSLITDTIVVPSGPSPDIPLGGNNSSVFIDLVNMSVSVKACLK